MVYKKFPISDYYFKIREGDPTEILETATQNKNPALNGGFFHTYNDEYGNKYGDPINDMVINHKIISQRGLSDYGIFIKDDLTIGFGKISEDYNYFIGGSPVLFENGGISNDKEGISDSLYFGKYYRSFFGFTSTDIIIGCTDEIVSIPTLKEYLREFNFIGAIALDGGGSAHIYTGEFAVFPSGENRAVANHIIIERKNTMQKLIMPVNKSILTAGFKNLAYKEKFGMSHFGLDMNTITNDNTIWGSGVGVVLAAGFDNFYGYVAIVKYDNVYNHYTKETKDVVIRYFHMDKVSVKVGDNVSLLTEIGVIGNAGSAGVSKHLHVEIDTDCIYYQYSPSSGLNDSNIIKKGTDTVVDPSHIFYIKPSFPDLQTVSYTAYTEYLNSDDFLMPDFDSNVVLPLSPESVSLKIGFASAGDVKTIIEVAGENGIYLSQPETGYLITPLLTPAEQIILIELCNSLVIPIVIYEEEKPELPTQYSKVSVYFTDKQIKEKEIVLQLLTLLNIKYMEE